MAKRKKRAVKKVSAPKKSRKRKEKPEAVVEPVSEPTPPKPAPPIRSADVKAKLQADERARIHRERRAG